jgi:hypothetical protein
LAEARQCKAVVFVTGAHTEFGKIAHRTETGSDVVSPLHCRLLRTHRERPVGANEGGRVVRPSGREDLAAMAVSAGSGDGSAGADSLHS